MPTKCDASFEMDGILIIHGVGENQFGQTLRALTTTVEKNFPAARLDRRTLVYSLPDRDEDLASADVLISLQNGRRMVVREVHWADFSSVAPGVLSILKSLASIVFDIPYLIGALVAERHWIATILRRSLLIATCFLRGPLSGINVCFFFIALIYLILRYFQFLEPTIILNEYYMLLASLALISTLGMTIGVIALRKDAGWTDVAICRNLRRSAFLNLLRARQSWESPRASKMVSYFTRQQRDRHVGFAVMTGPNAYGLGHLKALLFVPIMKKVMAQDRAIMGAAYANWKGSGEPHPAASPLDVFRPAIEAVIAGVSSRREQRLELDL